MNKISEKILDKIKQQHITPKPKWQFLLKDYLVWIMFVIATIIGSLSIGVIIYLLTDFDWTVYQYLHESFFEYFVISLPYLWFVLLIIFVGLAYYQFRHTKKGYRYRPYIIILLSISFSFILGFLLFTLGTARRFDQSLIKTIPPYEKIIRRKSHIWMNPERGLLAGKIIFIKTGQELELADFKKNYWQVNIEEAHYPSFIKLESGEIIRLVGEKQDDFHFKADKIMPWHRLSGKPRVIPEFK